MEIIKEITRKLMGSIRKRRTVLVLVTSFLLLAILLFTLTRTKSDEGGISYFSVGDLIRQPQLLNQDYPESPVVYVGFSLIPPSENDLWNYIEIQEITLHFSKNTQIDTTHFCIKEVNILYLSDTATNRTYHLPARFGERLDFENPICKDINLAELESTRTTLDYTNEILINLDAQPHNIIRYPYDDYFLYVSRLSIVYYLMGKDDISFHQATDTHSSNGFYYIEPIFVGFDDKNQMVYEKQLINYKNWYISPNREFDNLRSEIEINVNRSQYIQFLFPIIFVALFSFILLLIFVDNLGTFIEGAVGVFFGIFGVKELVTPANSDVLVIGDNLIQFAYLLFLVSMIIFLTKKYLQRNRNRIKPIPASIYSANKKLLSGSRKRTKKISS